MLIFILVFGIISFITVFNGISNSEGKDFAKAAEEEVWVHIRNKVKDTILQNYSDALFTENPVKLPDRGYSVINSFVDAVDEDGVRYRVFYSAHIQKTFGKWECHYVEMLAKTKVETLEEVQN